MDCEEKKVVKDAIFDFTKEYKERIVPMVESLIKECEQIGLPYLMHFVVRNDETSSSSGLMASAQDKPCIATSKLMATAHMINGDDDVIPVPLKAKNSSTMLALAALAASLVKDKE